MTYCTKVRSTSIHLFLHYFFLPSFPHRPTKMSINEFRISSSFVRTIQKWVFVYVCNHFRPFNISNIWWCSFFSRPSLNIIHKSWVCIRLIGFSWQRFCLAAQVKIIYTLNLMIFGHNASRSICCFVVITNIMSIDYFGSSSI